MSFSSIVIGVGDPLEVHESRTAPKRPLTKDLLERRVARDNRGTAVTQGQRHVAGITLAAIPAPAANTAHAIANDHRRRLGISPSITP